MENPIVRFIEFYPSFLTLNQKNKRNENDGLWRSTDDATTWSPVKIPIDPDRSVNMIGAALGLMIAGSSGESATLFISQDSGATWSDLNAQAGFPTISTCTGMECIGSTLFLCGYNEGPYGGVVSSSDTGKTWERVNEGLIRKDIMGLGVVDTVLLAGKMERVADEGCIFLSRDKGATWTKSQNGLPASCLKRVMAFGTCNNRIFGISQFSINPSSQQPPTPTVCHCSLSSAEQNKPFDPMILCR